MVKMCELHNIDLVRCSYNDICKNMICPNCILSETNYSSQSCEAHRRKCAVCDDFDARKSCSRCMYIIWLVKNITLQYDLPFDVLKLLTQKLMVLHMYSRLRKMLAEINRDYMLDNNSAFNERFDVVFKKVDATHD